MSERKKDLLTFGIVNAAAKKTVADSNGKLDRCIATASGAVASFPDGSALPARDVTVQIVPYQSGTGGPSPENIRPISGWTGANVYHSGADTSDYDTHPVTWQTEAGVVYGGTLYVTTGKLTAEYVFDVLDGKESWQSSSGNGYFILPVGNYGSVVNDAGVCSHIKENPSISGSNSQIGFRIYNRASTTNKAVLLFRFDSTKQQTLEQFKTYIAEQYAAETPVQVAYKLAPAYCTEYQLTPQEIELLLGENNVWADTGDTAVEYYADTKKYIDKLIAAAVQSSRGSRSVSLTRAAAPVPQEDPDETEDEEQEEQRDDEAPREER